MRWPDRQEGPGSIERNDGPIRSLFNRKPRQGTSLAGSFKRNTSPRQMDQGPQLFCHTHTIKDCCTRKSLTSSNCEVARFLGENLKSFAQRAVAFPN